MRRGWGTGVPHPTRGHNRLARASAPFYPFAMKFANTLILFGAAAAATATPLFVGHGLSSAHTDWVVYGAGAAAAAAALMWLHVRAARD